MPFCLPVLAATSHVLPLRELMQRMHTIAVPSHTETQGSSSQLKALLGGTCARDETEDIAAHKLRWIFRPGIAIRF